MARVPLIGEERVDLAPLIARLKTARGGRLINLYRMLLNSPRIAAAWLDFNSAVRFETELPDDVRELAIMRVSALNGADYQLRIHGAAYARKAGLTAEQIAALTAPAIPAGAFAPRDEAVLAYCDAMTRAIEVPDAVYAALPPHFSEQQIVELTVLIGAYNMHTRVARALHLDAEQQPPHR
jgi:AhpD family alkylhydroperoxidase